MITDWDDAYVNSAYIEGGSLYPDRWTEFAEAFRAGRVSEGSLELDLAYGQGARERIDLFHPKGRAKGLAVFVHGGYWMAFDKSRWSHLAAGALAQGWAVALPGYTLAPEARISAMTRQIGAAIAFAAGKVSGPIRLAGHSAGGHLVSRMVCQDPPLPAEIATRIDHVVSISGLHDLRPLMRTRMNEKLLLDEAEAVAESPALQRPADGCSITCWVGTDERPEFLRQNDLLANIWSGLGAGTEVVHAEGRHHFNVIADLTDPDSHLTRRFVGA